MSLINSVHTPSSYLLNIRFNIYSHVCAGLQSSFFPSGSPTKNLYIPHLPPTHAVYPVHLILTDLITLTIFGEEYISRSSLVCSLLYFFVTSSLLGPSTSPAILFSNTISLCFSLKLANQFNTDTKLQAIYLFIF